MNSENSVIPTVCFKGCLAIYSVIVWLKGFIYILFGTYLHSLLRNLLPDGQGLKECGTITSMAITIGLFLITLSFLTAFILLYSNRKRLLMFAVVIGVVLFIQVLCGICVLFFMNTLGETLKSGVKDSMETYDVGNKRNVELNTLQSKFGCCGSNTYKSWFDTYWAEGKAKVPASCCINVEKCHNRMPLMEEDIFQQGCNERITNVVGTLKVFVIFCIVSALVYQVIGIYLIIMVALREKEVGGESVLPVL